MSDDVFSICVYWSALLCLSMFPLECVCVLFVCVGRVYISACKCTLKECVDILSAISSGYLISLNKHPS